MTSHSIFAILSLLVVNMSSLDAMTILKDAGYDVVFVDGKYIVTFYNIVTALSRLDLVTLAKDLLQLGN